MGTKNTTLWILQLFLGIYFVFVGSVHFVLPDGLPSVMTWMYDLGDTTHLIAGVAEILGGLGLILPSVTRIRPELTVYAAGGLIIVMIGAAIWHLTRSETSQIITNGLNIVLLAVVGYGRLRVHPITSKT
jgi:uncharacterized membrane protein